MLDVVQREHLVLHGRGKAVELWVIRHPALLDKGGETADREGLLDLVIRDSTQQDCPAHDWTSSPKKGGLPITSDMDRIAVQFSVGAVLSLPGVRYRCGDHCQEQAA